MCDKFSLRADASTVSEQFRVNRVLQYRANRHDLAPVQDVSVVLEREGERQLDQFRWGLMPFWAKDSTLADSRTVFEKRAYRRILPKQRCVIPADAFYGWSVEGKNRTLIRLAMEGRSVFAMAGMYEEWRGAGGEVLRLCSVLSLPANRTAEPYMERMPVLLEEEAVEGWLSTDVSDFGVLSGLLERRENGKLLAYEVDSYEDDVEYSWTGPRDEEETMIAAWR